MRMNAGFAAFLLLWLAAWGTALLRGGFAAWFLVYAMLGIAVCSLLVRLFAFTGLEVRRQPEQASCYAGDGVEVAISLKLQAWLPLPWLLVRDSWKDSGSGRIYMHEKLLYPWFRRELEYRYKLAGLARGVYESEPAQAWTGDLLGLLMFRRQCSRDKRLLAVYPKPLPLPEAWRSGGWTGDGAPVAGFAANSPIAAGVRDYVQGDPMKRIHWKSAARGAGLKTKELETELNRRLIICLDAGYAAYADCPDAEELFERTIRTCAGLMQQAGREGALLGLAVHDRQGAMLSFQNGAVLQQGYGVLAKVHWDGDDGFGASVVRKATRFHGRATVVCVTPRLSVELVQSAFPGLSRMGKDMQLVLVNPYRVLGWEQRNQIRRLESMGVDVAVLPGTETEQGGIRHAGA